MVLNSVRASQVLDFEKKGSWHNVRGECLEYGKFKFPLCEVLGESPHCYILGFPWVELFHFTENNKFSGNLSLDLEQDFLKSFLNSNIIE